jgi:hypothetical protein
VSEVTCVDDSHRLQWWSGAIFACVELTSVLTLPRSRDTSRSRGKTLLPAVAHRHQMGE